MQKWNANFGFAIHPRYGPIMTVYAVRDIKRDEEIYVDYDYTEVDNFNGEEEKDGFVPRWYALAYEKEYVGKRWPGKHIFD